MLDDMPTTTTPAPARTPSVHGRAERTVARLLALVGVVGALVLLGAPAAQAHNTLRSSDPADGATVAFAPDRVTLTFDMAATAIGTEVVVTAADGRVVSAGPAELVDATVAQPLAGELPAGAYRVQWRVTSADGHPIEGTLGFTAAAATVAGTGGAPVPAPEPTPSDVAGPTSEGTISATSPAPTDDATAPAGDAGDDEPAVAGPLLVGLGGVLVVAGGVAAWYLLRRRPDEPAVGPASAGDGPGGDRVGPDA